MLCAALLAAAVSLPGGGQKKSPTPAVNVRGRSKYALSNLCRSFVQLPCVGTSGFSIFYGGCKQPNLSTRIFSAAKLRILFRYAKNILDKRLNKRRKARISA
jgi:hypothetical protein